jgi:periplasmic divalent cation tolerance protein
LVAELTERVKKLHSYDVPCVVSMQLLEGNQDFLDWIGRETG